jgi:DNA invertase Pin-like site-specific DNA recombinase
MGGRKVTEEQIERMIDLWKDRWSTKAIAVELNLSYMCVYSHLRKRYLVG